VRGYFNYFAVPTNGQALAAFRHLVTELWKWSLSRHPRWEPYALIGPVRFCAGGAQ
jgi:RNA-directed DNA polymerase